MKIEGKTAIVTGGASGIGKRIVETLYSLGANIIFCDINFEEGKCLESELQKDNPLTKVIFVHVNLVGNIDIKYLFNVANKLHNFNKIDILINNAGICNENKIWNQIDQVDNIINLNLNAVIKNTMLFVNESKNNNEDECVVVNVASLAGIIPNENLPIYSASKSAIIHYTKCLKYLRNLNNIRVNCVAPSFVLTNMTLNNPIVNLVDNKFKFWKPKNNLDKFGGFLTIDLVVDAVLKLIKNDKYYGDVLTVTPKLGIQVLD